MTTPQQMGHVKYFRVPLLPAAHKRRMWWWGEKMHCHSLPVLLRGDPREIPSPIWSCTLPMWPSGKRSEGLWPGCFSRSVSVLQRRNRNEGAPLWGKRLIWCFYMYNFNTSVTCVWFAVWTICCLLVFPDVQVAEQQRCCPCVFICSSYLKCWNPPVLFLWMGESEKLRRSSFKLKRSIEKLPFTIQLKNQDAMEVMATRCGDSH